MIQLQQKNKFLVNEHNEVPINFFLKGVRIQYKVELRDLLKYGVNSCLRKAKQKLKLPEETKAHIYYDFENPTLQLYQHIHINANIRRTIELSGKRDNIRSGSYTGSSNSNSFYRQKNK